MRTRPNLIVLFVAAITICVSSCARSGEPGNNRPGAQNSNEASSARVLYVEESARGDVERAALAVQTALENARQNRLQQAIEYLQAAAQHIAKTTTANRPDQNNAMRFQPLIEEIKGFIGAALNSARNGSSETTAQIEQARTALSGLKAKMGG
ncbi:MAG TPA: hypothetical protein VLM38_24365 [Blastocatellia bacterium]|nr:hypothetical protein [Blastocatellia bacterium]